MSGRLNFTPSMVADTTIVTAVCTKAECLSRRRLPMAEMAEAGYDLPLYVLESRLRCKGRGRCGTKPECGAPVEIDIWTPMIRINDHGAMEDLPVCKPGC